MRNRKHMTEITYFLMKFYKKILNVGKIIKIKNVNFSKIISYKIKITNIKMYKSEYQNSKKYD